MSALHDAKARTVLKRACVCIDINAAARLDMTAGGAAAPEVAASVETESFGAHFPLSCSGAFVLVCRGMEE